MKTLTIHGIDPELVRNIKERAQQGDLSVNQWVIQALKKIAFSNKDTLIKKYHELDELAGGWSKGETGAFRKNMKIFARIDEDHYGT